MSEELLITGYHCLAPSCESVGDFFEKLCSKEDLVTSCNDKKWPKDFHHLPNRMGQVLKVEQFDNIFFGMNAIQTDNTDPQIRLLLESVYEAFLDAGLTMAQVAGSNTGVYIGGCFSDHHRVITSQLNNINGYENSGCASSMFANKISYFFNLHGPSMAIDTACSSSLTALSCAVDALKLGKIDRAVVGGISLIFSPGITKSFNEFHMLSKDGKCFSFDERANGFVRAESIGVVIIEKGSSKRAERAIAEIVGIGCNEDGYKIKGITFPSAELQETLLRKVLSEVMISPDEIGYVEAHGTGTVAGDSQELLAIDNVYGKNHNKENPLLIGSVKSNMGHAEGASGIMSLIKILLAFDTDTIPPNIHFQTSPHKPINEGRMKVVTEPTSYSKTIGNKLSCISNFGFGGANVHLILKRVHPEYLPSKTSDKNYIFGRNEETIKKYKTEALANTTWWRSIRSHASDIRRFPVRAIAQDGVIKATTKNESKPKIAFCYSGQGSHWLNMAKDLWEHEPIFKQVILDSTKDLAINAAELFEKGDQWTSQTVSGLGITLVQLGLTDLLKKKHNIEPDYIFGHSVGEVACGYAAGCNSAAECAEIAYARCRFSKEISADGLMAVLGVPYDKAETLIKETNGDVVIACWNAVDSVTISGDAKIVTDLVKKLTAQKVFARIIDTDNVAYHSIFFKRNSDRIENELDRIIKKREHCRTIPASWISTSNPDNKSSDARYHTDNIVGEVRFSPIISELSEETIVIEVAPNSIMRSQIRRNNPKLKILPTMCKDQDNVAVFNSAIDNLWLNGYTLTHDIIEEDTNNRLSFPSKEKFNFNHSESWRVPTLKEFSNTGELSVTYNLETADSYLRDHVINDKALFPAMGHIYTIWQLIGLEKKITIKSFRILKAVLLDKDSIELKVKQMDNLWRIYYDNELVSTGEVYITEPSLQNSSFVATDEPDTYIDHSKLYNYFGRYRYDYKGTFRVIDRRYVNGRNHLFRECKHLVSYLDGLLQASLQNITSLFLPTSISEIRLAESSLLLINEDRHVNFDPLTNTITSKYVTIKGLETSYTKNKYPTPATNVYKFVPYKCQLDTTDNTHYSIIHQLVKQNININESKYAVFDFTENNDFKQISSNDTIIVDSANKADLVIINNLTQVKDLDITKDRFIMYQHEITEEKIDNVVMSFVDKKILTEVIFQSTRDLSSVKALTDEKDIIEIINSEKRNLQEDYLLKINGTDKTNPNGFLGFAKSINRELDWNKKKNRVGVLIGDKNPNNKLLYNIYSKDYECYGSFFELPYDYKPATNNGYHLVIDKPGDLSSFQWAANQVASNIDVKYCGFNFKDVMLSYGKLSKPNPSIGLEFSGVTTDGKRVCAMYRDCFSTKIYCPDKLYWQIPDNLSFQDAVTVPVVYATSYYALIVKANIRRGQSVLIHSIAGGIGHACYHIAKFRGAKIFATCSNDKREYVKTEFGLSDDQIFDSRSTSFKEDIIKVTNGRGVDVVVNSLAGDKLLASIDCLSSYGHFCEIGKYDIQENTPIGMKALERNISVHIIDLTDIMENEYQWEYLYELMSKGFQTGEIVPLKYKIFQNIEEGLRYMSTGKHIGKIILDLSDKPFEHNNYPIVSRFNTTRTHAVIGGLGGFGLELVEWLLNHGADQVIILARSEIKNGYQKSKCQKYGNRIIVQILDPTNYTALEKYFKTLIDSKTELEGIWNLAMSLNDTLFENMSQDKWCDTVASKKTICQNLDKVSRHFYPSLRYFVMYSSVTALFGNIGQTNYTFGNSYMEEVCRQRRLEGLNGLAIQWGAIDNVGYLSNDSNKLNTNLTILPQNINNCLSTLEKIINSPEPVVTSYLLNTKQENSNQTNKTVAERIAGIMGIKIVDVNDTSNLVTYGIDSLQTVEIRNLLKDKGIEKQTADIGQMTWKDLKQIN